MEGASDMSAGPWRRVSESNDCEDVPQTNIIQPPKREQGPQSLYLGEVFVQYVSESNHYLLSGSFNLKCWITCLRIKLITSDATCLLLFSKVSKRAGNKRGMWPKFRLEVCNQSLTTRQTDTLIKAGYLNGKYTVLSCVCVLLIFLWRRFTVKNSTFVSCVMSLYSTKQLEEWSSHSHNQEEQMSVSLSQGVSKI